VGDDKVSDIAKAKAAGLSAHRYLGGRANRYERALAGPALDGSAPAEGADLVRSAFAGAARATRLRSLWPDARRATIASAAADVAGPLMFAFVLWTLRTARAKGFDRLYFIARDGQILREIADRICARLGWSVDCRYLYGSRQSWRLAGVRTIGPFEREWMTEGADGQTICEALARCGLAASDVAEALEACGAPRATWGRPLGPEAGARLESVIAHAAVREAILASAARRRAAARAYFAQEGVCDGRPIGLVDIGWNGSLQKALAQILSAEHENAGDGLAGFYFGLTRTPPAGAGAFYAACGPQEADPVMRIGALYPALLEIFCAADHGTVQSFRRTADGGGEPVLAEARNSAALDWGLEVQQAQMIAFADAMLDAVDLGGLDVEQATPNLLQAALSAFAAFAETPGRDEAEAYGRFPHARDQGHVRLSEMAGRVTGLEAPLFLAAPGRYRARTSWRPGTAARSAPAGFESAATRLLMWRRLALERARRMVRPGHA